MIRMLRFFVLLLNLYPLGTALSAQTLASAKPPGYPLAAKAAGIDGPVVLKATISKEGKVLDLHVVSGPPELRQAAMDAVMRWTYKPYMHFGHAIDVDTTITVNFDMGKGAKKAAEQAKAQVELTKVQQAPQVDNPQPPTPK